MAQFQFALDRVALIAPPDQPLLPVRQLSLAGRLRSHLQTDGSWLPTLLRVTLGGVIFGHGLQKVFGWFGGYGIKNTMAFFESIGMPSVLGALVIETINTGIVILGIDQNYSQIIIGSVVIVAVVFDQVNAWIAKRRLTARAGG